MYTFLLRVGITFGLTAWFGFACASKEKPANDDELSISEESAANSAIEKDDASALSEGNSADFSGSDTEKDDFSSPSDKKSVQNDLFADEKPESDDDKLIDPTAGEDNVAQETIGDDPTAIPGADNQGANALPPVAVDPIAAAAAEATASVASSPPLISASDDIDPIEAGFETDLTAPGQVENPNPIASDSPKLSAGITPAPAAQALPKDPGIESASSPIQNAEVDPAPSLLSWVGYQVQEKDRSLKIEILSRGHPDFEIFEEQNKAQQLELVLRFYQTKLRQKLRYDINSSEFRSPVAYIRMREYNDKGIVDVVLTHRDPIMPNFFAKNGRMLLVYALPEHYFNSTESTARIIKERGKSLIAGNETPLRQKNIEGLASPQNLGAPRGRLFENLPTALRPIREIIRSHHEDQLDSMGLPNDFDRRDLKQEQRSANVLIDSFSLSSVGQDELEAEPQEAEIIDETIDSSDDSVNESNGNTAGTGNASNVSNAETNGSSPKNSVQEVPTETTSNSEEAPGLNSSQDLQNSDIHSNQASKIPVPSPTPQLPSSRKQQEAPRAKGPVSDVTITNEALGESSLPEDAAIPPTSEAPVTNQAPARDVVGKTSPAGARSYVGKPVFMEFYDAPLSLVLKGFSEETGNNFVYSNEVGSTPVTVQFKGVPWDEALKAILETYSLGMVRIGENVVRVDMITKLTQYMQELEQAGQFETRRVPTRILIFRLNNALAKDMVTRILALLARDVELDPRIKVQADDRTNSIVMEAPTPVLAKTKSIIERLDLETPQVEIASRIVEVQKTVNNFFGVAWGNNFNFDPGRALGFGSLNFPNSVGSSFSVDPGVIGGPATNGLGRFRFGSLNKFVDLDLLLKMEEKKGTTNILQSNRVLVLDGQKASVLAGSSKFFRPAAGATGPVPGTSPAAAGLAEVKFDLFLEVKPQISAMGSVIMDLTIRSDTPVDPTGEVLASKNSRELVTQMVRQSGDTGVIGGIYDTSRVESVSGVPFLSDIPILGALFRSSTTKENQTELLIMVTPTVVTGR
ncbi:MAG: hypothetical protein NTX25_19700, partial [Proteobacteria bacterium]|nr:hypothetical protein [Pseudomonadota bacterium]